MGIVELGISGDPTVGLEEAVQQRTDRTALIAVGQTMAATTRRKISRLVCAPCLAAAIALPAVTTGTDALAQAHTESASAPSQPTPTPEPSSPAEPSSPTEPPSPAEPSSPSQSNPSQEADREEMVEETHEKVDNLIANADGSQEVEKAAENLDITLDVIEDPKTPPEVKAALTKIVEPVTFTLEILQDQKTPPEHRRSVVKCADQLIITFKVMRHPKLSPEHLDAIEEIIIPVTISLRIINERKMPPKQRDTVEETLHPETSALEIVNDLKTPPQHQLRTWRAMVPLTNSLKEMQGSKTSENRRAEIEKTVKRQTIDLNKAMNHLKALGNQFTEASQAIWALIEADNSACKVTNCRTNWTRSDASRAISFLAKVDLVFNMGKVIALRGNLATEQKGFDKALAESGGDVESKEVKAAADRLDQAKRKLHRGMIDLFPPIAIFMPLPAE